MLVSACWIDSRILESCSMLSYAGLLNIMAGFESLTEPCDLIGEFDCFTTDMMFT